jgi:UDP-4-amino-4,6-dideoxy-N-acetyl-beta-L-altrosamine transaminase
LEKSEFIPYGRQDVVKEDIEAVVNVLRSDFLTQGEVVPAFEKKLCDYTGVKYAVAVNSCTSALHIACLALGLGDGDILWTSPISFVATANCALYCGASIDFVDIDVNTALMSVERLKQKLEQAEKEGKLPKIIIPVHFSGQPCDMKEIYDLSRQYGFKIIEDAAHAIGATYHNNPVGNCKYSDIAVFSFHPVKIITTGEGGSAMTNNIFLAEKMRLFRSHGIKKHKAEKGWLYSQSALGYNYRMTDIHAALGLSQIQRLGGYIKKRIKIAKLYGELFHENNMVKMLLQLDDRISSHHLFVIKVNPLERKFLFNNFRNLKIGVNVHYIPIHLQPYYRKMGFKEGDFPQSEQYYSRCISLPIYPKLRIKDVEKIARFVKH